SRTRLLLLAALACGDPDHAARPITAPTASTARGPDAREGDVGGRAIVSLTLSPNPLNLGVGATSQLALAATSHTGEVSTKPAGATWTTDDATIATVSSLGVVTGVAAGTAHVRATAANGVFGETTVNVTGSPPPPPTTHTLLAAGDIAVCGSSGDEATATLLDAEAGTVLALGDLAYPNGTTADFTNCYDTSWGRHKARTLPVPGNHEYGTANASPYFTYFGATAGNPGKGYYSYDLGAWHVVALNSNCIMVSCAIGSAQEVWLKADLAATTKPCILAYWHHARWSSDASHGNNTKVQPLVRALFNAGADVLLSAHAHLYERFGLQDPSNNASPVGIRQFVVGTGGRTPLYSWGAIKPNSQVRNNTTLGVLKLTLGATSYSWSFLPVAGSTFTDSGTQACH
ncbi:MAG: Ig-like domain-containing protein, partial [Gemmatimonadetes bacterium]|nr:Ig-like domain-containing protein [Gemmatimonadota bacterium]